MRRVCAMLALVASILSYRPYVASAAQAGAIIITVVDARSGAALPLARIDLYGPKSARGFTDLRGLVTFRDLPPGTYEAEIDSRGHKHLTVTKIVLSAAQRLTLREPMALTPLVIANAIVRKPKETQPLATVSESGPAASLGQSVTSALNTLPGVTINGANGFNEYLSVGGHNPTQTGIDINGVPVGVFGTAANLAPLDIDLFSSANVDSSSAGGFSGGAVNLTTRDPTLDWLGSAKLSQGSFGNSASTLFEGGTSGRFGVAYTHAFNERGSPLDGLSYLDTSGLFYSHDALSRNIGDAFKVRYPFSENNVATFSEVLTNSRLPIICNQFTGPVPCGFGPTNVTTTKISATSLTDVASLPFADVKFSVFSNRQYENIDQSGHFISGIPAPLISTSTTTMQGVDLQTQIHTSLEHPLQLNFNTTSQSAKFAGGAYGSYAPPAPVTTSFSNLSITVPIHSGRRLGTDATFGIQRNPFATHATLDGGVSYRLSNQDSINVHLNGGSLAIPNASFQGVSEPAAFAFDCQAHTGLGFGPSLSSGRSSTINSSLGFQHSGSRASFGIGVERQTEYNAPISAIVSAAGVPSSFITPGYLAAASSAGENACKDGRPYSISDLYYRVSGIADRIVHDNYTFQFRTPIGRDTNLDLSYAITAARALGSDPFVFGRSSTVRQNIQLPNIPMHSGSLQLSTALGRNGAQALLSISYTGSNNAYNLPAILTIAAGAAVPMEHGTLQVAVSNLTGQFPGPFASNIGAVPLPLNGGGLFPTVASPLSPRTYSASYKFLLGPPHEENFSSNNNIGISWMIRQLPTKPQQNLLDPARDNMTCGPELIGKAKDTLDALKAYVASIEAARTTAGYPPIFKDGTKNGFRFSYRPNGRRYAVLVSPSSDTVKAGDRAVETTARPFMGCARIWSVSLATAQQAGLYVMSHDEMVAQGFPTLIFDPTIGFYQSPDLITGHRFIPFELPPAPSKAPANPFLIANSPDCTDTIRPAATDLLEELRQYVNSFYSGNSKIQPPLGLDITSYKGASGAVLQIRDITGALLTLGACMQISQITYEQLQQLGLAPPTKPSTIAQSQVNFAPRLGFFYIVPHGKTFKMTF